MELNKKKSAVLPFAPRMAKDITLLKLEKTINQTSKKCVHQEWIPAMKEINGVPVVNKYKYLGIYMDSKITMKTQLTCIQKKANFLFVQLYPYLSSATADGRRDMWITMISPLFYSLLLFAKFETSQAEINKMKQLLIGTFKKFLLIPKSTNTELVEEMIGFNLAEVAERLKQNAGEQNTSINFTRH